MIRYNKYTPFQKKDIYETPEYVIADILTFLDKNKVEIYEPFKGSGSSTKIMRKLGFTVHNGDHKDFFKQTFPKPRDKKKKIILLTNPPFSIKKEILQKLQHDNVGQWILLLPASVLYTMYFRDLFKNKTVKLIIPRKRITFIDPKTKKPFGNRASFDTAWICRGISLPRHINLI